MAITPKLMTADELSRLPRGRQRHELVRGVLRTMPLAFMEEAIVASNLTSALWKADGEDVVPGWSMAVRDLFDLS
jgi:hypothetical protein